MAVLRLANGGDVTVKASVTEALAALTASEASPFVEMVGQEGTVHIRPSGVLAVIEDSPRGTAGFRIGTNAAER